MTQREPSFLSDVVDPHNIRLQKISCYGGSYYATIAVVLY
jgi:hypothetical protein